MSIIVPPGQDALDRETYMSAISAMEEFGDRATEFAAKRSARSEIREDYQASRHWDRVIMAILELERTWLRSGESLN